MNEDLKRALQEVTGHFWPVTSETAYWETLWPAIERWHEAEVARLRSEEHTDPHPEAPMPAALRGMLWAAEQAAKGQLHAEPQPPEPAPALVMPPCARCHRPFRPGDRVRHEVATDYSLAVMHESPCSCWMPGDAISEEGTPR